MNVSLSAETVWEERTCEIAGNAAQNARAVSSLSSFFFGALDCQICAALAKVQPTKPSLRVSYAFPNAGAPLRTRKIVACWKGGLRGNLNGRSYPRSWRKGCFACMVLNPP